LECDFISIRKLFLSMGIVGLESSGGRKLT